MRTSVMTASKRCATMPASASRTDPRAEAGGLGGEVRIEHPRTQMRRYAGAIVGDRHIGAVQRGVDARGEPNLARRRLVLQRLLRIDDEVEQHLMQLIRVGEHQR